MLKRIVASLLTSVGLLSLNANATLAKPADHFTVNQTFHPSTCDIAINGKEYSCDYAVMGAFNNGSANLKFCSANECFILIITRAQFNNLAEGEDFSVRQIAWQRGGSITNQWNTSMQCGFDSDALGCVGKLSNGSKVAIYVE